MMWRAMSSSRRLLFSLALSISMLSALLGASALGSDEDGASLAIAGAEDAVASAYRAVLEAEGAGADIRDLAARLNNACNLLVQASFLYNAGNLDEAFRLANLCVDMGGEVAKEARARALLAILARIANFQLTIALSFFSVALIACISFYSWRVFKRRYIRRVLEMRPEVVSVEP